jgi:hypothetical protein
MKHKVTERMAIAGAIALDNTASVDTDSDVTATTVYNAMEETRTKDEAVMEMKQLIDTLRRNTSDQSVITIRSHLVYKYINSAEIALNALIASNK